MIRRSVFFVLFMIILFVIPISGLCGDKNDSEYDVVIIGAGAGGLSAGATLSRAGVKTLVLEQHDRPGGYMTAFNRGDYRFEVSLHWMDGLDPGGWTRELFHNLGILDRVEPIKMDHIFRLMGPDFSFEIADTFHRRSPPTDASRQGGGQGRK